MNRCCVELVDEQSEDGPRLRVQPSMHRRKDEDMLPQANDPDPAIAPGGLPIDSHLYTNSIRDNALTSMQSIQEDMHLDLPAPYMDYSIRMHHTDTGVGSQAA
jgi:hypothetical protein